MRNFLKLGVVAVFLIAVVCIMSMSKAQATASTSRVLGFDSTSTRTLFLQNCARCHGASGKAETALGKKLKAADLTSADVKGMSTAKITRTIKNGRPDMPAYDKKLTPAQIKSLAGYVRSL